METQELHGIRLTLEALKKDAEKLREQIEPLMAAWRHKQEQIAALEHALKLLEAEPTPSDLQATLQPDGGVHKPSEVAYRLLAKAKRPLHYRELLGLMEASGFAMPGENPGANLLAHIGRDERIVRVGSGTYGLAEWGMKKPAARRRRKQASRPSRRTR